MLGYAPVGRARGDKARGRGISQMYRGGATAPGSGGAPRCPAGAAPPDRPASSGGKLRGGQRRLQLVRRDVPNLACGRDLRLDGNPELREVEPHRERGTLTQGQPEVDPPWETL